ncbi:hypothetical protein [Paraburkholderia sp. BL10I2N1]|uniref:hypothetical protein n=1 Tax=Paraburkholderia sp. BL10I2N1 TaxID=1938796 RepID=UPI00105D6BF1|nr:hypothetical protein [Paraburkholderia sp. BL10I2N1]TDN61725.1 hypothetical protein B0G77_5218 [Paraburkholderia sp. BL10I2N1]
MMLLLRQRSNDRSARKRDAAQHTRLCRFRCGVVGKPWPALKRTPIGHEGTLADAGYIVDNRHYFDACVRLIGSVAVFLKPIDRIPAANNLPSNTLQLLITS